jgi:hypothetical protein
MIAVPASSFSAEDHQAGKVFAGAQRRGKDVEQVAAPHVLEEGHGDLGLGAEQHLPQKDAAQEQGDVDGRVAGGEEYRDVAPDHQFDEGPVDDLEDPGDAAPEHVNVAQHHGRDALAGRGVEPWW